MKVKDFFIVLLNIILFPFKMVLYALLYFYKWCISPLLPHICKFTPTCSEYFLQALREYGVIKGCYLGLKRLFRCTPFTQGGWDPIKPNIKGNIKWIL